MPLIFPTKERSARLKTGGLLYFFLGLILVSIGLFSSEWIFYFCGGISALIGFFLLGYRKKATLDRENNRLLDRKGFYFVQFDKVYSLTDVTQIIIRRKVSLGQRFSRFDNQMHDSTLKISYLVLLRLNDQREITLDASDKEKAQLWAQTIKDYINVDICYEEPQKENSTEAISGNTIHQDKPTKSSFATLIFSVIIIVFFTSLFFIAENLFPPE